jgi:hypothetical protein
MADCMAVGGDPASKDRKFSCTGNFRVLWRWRVEFAVENNAQTCLHSESWSFVTHFSVVKI